MNTPNIKAAKQAAKEFIERADVVLVEYKRDGASDAIFAERKRREAGEK